MTIAIHGNPATVAAADVAAIKRHRLEGAAVQFEAMMLGEMLKPLREGASVDGAEKGDEGTGSSAILTSYGTEAVAGALAKAGGLGFAKRILKRMDAHSVMKEEHLKTR